MSVAASVEGFAVRQGSPALKPANLTFEQAAAVPLAAVTALQSLRAGGIQPGQHARNVDRVRRLGAEHVIDYTEHDFTVGAARYDLALQLGGTYSPAAVRKVLTTPVIGPIYPLTDAAAAVRLVEEGSPPGKVIVMVDPFPSQLPRQ